MNSNFPHVWDISITNYWFFYIVFGFIAFALCYYSRFFFYAVIPVLIWFCISDLHSFYYQDTGSNNLGPDSDYIFQVVISMIFTFISAGLGTYLNWRKNRFKF